MFYKEGTEREWEGYPGAVRMKNIIKHVGKDVYCGGAWKPTP